MNAQVLNIEEAQEALRLLNAAYTSAVLANLSEGACFKLLDTINYAEMLIKDEVYY